ncbi:hypothetical protein AVV09_gp90 [Mycobacterium phage BrownCNA]|uniref:Uncharacterized protein n=2 Tax=Coopervirus brownCNA TaxID=1983108 RepID=A0A0K1Y7A5_9CAUD|nr:hypothetical protein AVV09_gp90 [Mycobacterium phage BrownCNA]AKY02803.1 hypothetical protein SEA_BROWNCNA_90 [Mycobacterium phage BrownCNA]QOC58650.1 hypothetical protein SEALOLALOVE_92 [Mycobacterium phage Lolalove]UVK59566.1 hypothetical protein SEA_AUSTELLE_90 [Mycobacterium phage Austelle]WNM65109.1 hypothetical protein SEA_MUDSLIDE_91 [Mycobacterium phage Mudslide]
MKRGGIRYPATTTKEDPMSDNEGEKAVAAEAAPVNPIRANDLRRQAAQMLEEAGRIDRLVAAEELRRREERRPKMPPVHEGESAVVIFTKYQAGREYHYAAVGWRQGRSVRWAVTGNTTDRLNWPGLLQFIGEGNWPSLRVVTDTENIGPSPDEEEPVAERMGAYGRVLGTSGVVDPLVHAEVPRYADGGVVRGQGGSGGRAYGITVVSPFGREDRY